MKIREQEENKPETPFNACPMRHNDKTKILSYDNWLQGDSMVRGLAFFLRLAVVLFPLLAGSFLLYLGTDKLNQAYFQREQWVAPNGLLAFSSMQAQVSWAHLGMHAMSAKNGLTDTYLDYDLRLQSGFVPGEQVGGFQIPYGLSSLNFTVTVWSGQGDNVALAILDQGTISVEEPAKATIVYGKFQVPANAVTCHMFLNFQWDGLFVREGFSSYALMVPFANSNETVHSKVFECCPNAVALFDNVPFVVEIEIPYDSELKEGFPAPDTQEITTGKPHGNLVWYYNITANQLSMPSSNQFRVEFEVPSDAELRNRLFFDSGLYMGLGISLIFSGIYEGLKSAEDSTRRRREPK